jgi:hypothetical protein
MAFDATPASLAFAEATATVGGMSVIFGPVGLTLGVLTSVGFLGYQLFKSDVNKQSSFYIERAGPSSPGGHDPDPNKNKADKNGDKPIVIRGKSLAPKKGTPGSVYEKVDNEDSNLVVSRTTYDNNGYPAAREDYYKGSNPQAHFDKESGASLKNHKHIFRFNDKGQPLAKEKVVPLEP